MTSANETSAPGYFNSSYAYGLGGRFTNANLAQSSPPTGSDLKPRNVNYVYADPDPERVTSLVNATNGSRYATYTYDEAGNQITRCYGATSSPCSGESLDYVHDGKNQLRRATKKNAGVVQGSEEYWYDADGNRFAVVKRDASGTKTETVVFVNDLEAHYTAANSNNLNYTHLSMGTPVARVTRQSNSIAIEYQFQGLGSSLLATVSSTGTTNAAFSYSPFGELLETTGPDVVSHRNRFNEKYQDNLTELSYYGHRYLDRSANEWTQSDPMYRVVPDLTMNSSPRRANLYTFTLNNPLRYIDPDGDNPQDIADAVQGPSSSMLHVTAISLRIADNAKGKGEAAERGATLAVVIEVAKEFGLGRFATNIRVENNPTVGGKQVLGKYDPLTDSISIKKSEVWGSGVMAGHADPIKALLILAHELVHREQNEDIHGLYSAVTGNVETEAYNVERQILNRLFAEGKIGVDQYIRLSNWISDSEDTEAHPECLPCSSSLHQHVDLASSVYRKKATTYIQGLWGVFPNPDGPVGVKKY